MTDPDLALLTPISSGGYRTKPVFVEDEDQFIPDSLERWNDRKFSKEPGYGPIWRDRW